MCGWSLREEMMAEKADPPGVHDENKICYWYIVQNSIIIDAVIPLLEGQ
jgi:hypothetical protein